MMENSKEKIQSSAFLINKASKNIPMTVQESITIQNKEDQGELNFRTEQRSIFNERLSPSLTPVSPNSTKKSPQYFDSPDIGEDRPRPSLLEFVQSNQKSKNLKENTLIKSPLTSGAVLPSPFFPGDDPRLPVGQRFVRVFVHIFIAPFFQGMMYGLGESIVKYIFSGKQNSEVASDKKSLQHKKSKIITSKLSMHSN